MDSGYFRYMHMELRPTRKLLITACLSILGSLMIPVAVANLFADEQSPGLKVVETQTYIVTLKAVQESACCPGEKELVLSVTDKKKQTEATLTPRGRIRTVADMFISGSSRLVVIGELPYGGNTFFIVDLVQRQLEETIWAYGYAISPSKRFLVYETHYPRMMTPDARRSILLVYDMAKSAAENRLLLHESSSSKERGFIPEYSSTGVPVFPETNATKTSYIVTLEEDHLYMSPFLWAENEKQIVFLEFYQNKNYLVVLNLGAQLVHPEIVRERIDIQSLVRGDVIDPGIRQELGITPYKFLVTELHWKDSDTIIVRPYPQFWLAEKVELRLPSISKKE